MATNLLWFVMAGFLLGFATSTLWEWFYFRKERLKLTDRRIRELEARVRDAEADSISFSPTNTIPTGPVPTVASVTGSAPRTAAWGEASYRSPGVFLESEEYDMESEGGAASGRERPQPRNAGGVSTPTNPPVNIPPAVPTANSVIPLTPPSTAAKPLESSVTPRADMAQPDASRLDHPTPADALRAKRGPTPRSRQEVLAALRRNSEAVQRGQFPPPAGSESQPELPPPFVPRTTTLVSATPPASEEAPPELPASAPAQPEINVAPPAPPLSSERQRWMNNPELTERTREYPDDLSKIKGIGDVYKQRLYRAGIYTWKQIAETDTETLRRATNAYPSSNVEEWLVQAERLMEKHGRKHAIYSGPQPDDMTKILGIGPVGASVLYRAGICTYEQLASTSIADLEALFPIAVAGDQPDFAQWITRATALADEKHRDK